MLVGVPNKVDTACVLCSTFVQKTCFSKHVMFLLLLFTCNVNECYLLNE